MEINYVLIASIAIVALSTYIGFRKGLLLTVYSAGAMLIAIALAYILMPYGTKLLKQTGIYDVVYEKVNDAVNDVMGSGDTDNKGEQAEAIDSMEVPGYTKDVLHDNNNSKVYDMMESTGFRDYVDNSVTIMIMNAISALIIFLVIFIIIRIIGMFRHFDLFHVSEDFRNEDKVFTEADLLVKQKMVFPDHVRPDQFIPDIAEKHIPVLFPDHPLKVVLQGFWRPDLRIRKSYPVMAYFLPVL